MSRAALLRGWLGLFLGLLLGMPGWAGAETFTVRSLPNDTFVPSNVTIQVGDSVRFVNEGNGFHNVIEDGGAFRCAEGCDGQGGDGDPSAADWSFTLTFPTAGTIGYYCDVHGSPGVGMIGKIQVIAPGSPGRFDFSAESYSVGEASGGTSIVVRRTEGTTGAVSVRYAASAGTASAADFTPTSGTLSWADGETAVKTFSISVANDSLIERSETVLLKLSQPTGGAALGRASAVLTLIDDDVVSSPGRLRFRAPVFAGAEGDEAKIGVVREEGAVGAVSVGYATSDGTAAAGSDYPATSGTIAFAAEESGEKTISIPLAEDDDVAAEEFEIALLNPTGGAALRYPSRATGVILPEAAAVEALTAEEVACDAARLSGLLARSRSLAPRSSRPTSLAVSFTGTGDFAGLSTTGIGGGTGEAALAFSTNPEETTLLANPSRPQLFSVSLARNELNSDLVAPGSADELRLTINPTLDANPPAGNLLAIDNLQATSGRPADAKPGRGLAPLLASCHGDFGVADVQLFRVLPKLARGEAAGASGFELAIYRAPEPGRYRFDLFPLDAQGAASGRLAVDLEVVRSAGGDLVSGTLRRLGPCAAGQETGCSDLTGLAANAALAFWKPVLSGPPPATPYRISASGSPEVAVDFADLLAGTAWRRPLE
ncbi:MAG TPA: Calx-beta domain-containing protein [Thermoanaerobaculia bacterium]|nr:Calx-beta domain-containing protein [Thermoanaerobaculia bacterium]